MANAKKSKQTLDGFELGYEELKKTKKTKNNTKKAVVARNNTSRPSHSRRFVFPRFRNIHNNLSGIVSKVKIPRKKHKKTTKEERRIARNQRNRAILGVGQLLVVVSIAYSTAVIYIGVDSLASRVALIPQAVFGLVILIKAFSKLYK